MIARARGWEGKYDNKEAGKVCSDLTDLGFLNLDCVMISITMICQTHRSTYKSKSINYYT